MPAQSEEAGVWMVGEIAMFGWMQLETIYDHAHVSNGSTEHASGIRGRFKEHYYPHHGMHRTTRKRDKEYTFFIWQDVYRNNNNNNKKRLLLQRYKDGHVGLIAHVNLQQQQQQAWYL